MIRGFDASEVQGLLPFDRLDPSLRFVILKAQQGNDGFDPFFERNMRAALAAGLVPFAYAFAYPLPPAPDPHGIPGRLIFGRDPIEQAKLCVDRILAFPEMRGRPIFLDLEWPAPTDWATWGCTAASVSAWCQAFCAEVARLSGVAPIIYTYPDWWHHVSAADVSWAAAYGLWLAAYVVGWPAAGSSPRVPFPWTDWLFWQFDGDKGLRLPNGVDADFCVCNGDETTLRALGRTPVTNDVGTPAAIDGGTVHAEFYSDEPPPEAA